MYDEASNVHNLNRTYMTSLVGCTCILPDAIFCNRQMNRQKKPSD